MALSLPGLCPGCVLGHILAVATAAGHKINKFIYLHSQRLAHTQKPKGTKLSDSLSPLSFPIHPAISFFSPHTHTHTQIQTQTQRGYADKGKQTNKHT